MKIRVRRPVFALSIMALRHRLEDWLRACRPRAIPASAAPTRSSASTWSVEHHVGVQVTAARAQANLVGEQGHDPAG